MIEADLEYLTKNWMLIFRNDSILDLFYIPTIGIFDIKKKIAKAKNTSILLGDYFYSFINKQIQTVKYSSASEVVRTALRMFEHSENKKTEVINELKKGEKSGLITHFNRQVF